MTVNEFMDPHENHQKGYSTGSDFLLAVGTGSSPGEYSVLSENLFDIRADIVSDMERKCFVIGGGKYRRKTAVRKFSVTGFRDENDPSVALLCGTDMLFATDHNAVLDYVYLNVNTGRGERGKAAVHVVCDMDSGSSCGEPALFAAELYGCGGPPKSYIYSKAGDVDEL